MYRQTEKWIAFCDQIVKPLVWLSFLLTILEVGPEFGMGAEEGSRNSHWGFLWAERAIALFFTFEFVLRLIRSGPKRYVWVDRVFPYVHIQIFAWIDLIAIIPFWLGFFLPADWLRYVRMARVFRLLKYYRYSRSLQLNALAFYRAMNQLRGLAFQLFILCTFFTLIVFEAEHREQPEAFSNLAKSSWFTVVTATTVGYGDRSPVTVVGMTVVLFSLPIIIAQMCGAIGIFNAAYTEVMDQERDPNVDPIDLFEREAQHQAEIKRMDKDYVMKEE